MKLTCAYAAITVALFSTSAIAAAGHTSAAPTMHRSQPTTLGPTKTGQPNKSCEQTPNPPGKSASAPGSAFNPSGTAGSVYAGEQPQNSRNTASVSQYDVACARR